MWKIEWLGFTKRWRQIGYPADEAEALRLFAYAVHDYPADHLVRLVRPNGSTVVKPAQWALETPA
jgi:hypothetical protein